MHDFLIGNKRITAVVHLYVTEIHTKNSINLSVNFLNKTRFIIRLFPTKYFSFSNMRIMCVHK